MNSEDACVICGKRDQLFRCSQCRAALYCSKDHQRQHWRFHKNSCIFSPVTISPNHRVGGGLPAPPGCHSAGQVVTPPDVRGICQSRDESAPVNNCSRTHEATLGLATLSLKADTSADSHPSPDETMPSLNSALPRSPLSVGSVLQQQAKDLSVIPDLGGEHPPFQHNSLLQKSSEDPMKRHTAEWILQVCQFVVNDLDKYGICVVDNFLGKERGEMLLKTVESMYDSGVFQEGEVVSSKVKTSRNIRGDKITWVDGTETGTAAISYLISMVDSVVMHAKRMKLGKISQYDISGRTKAMVACYPGHGTHYVKHVDNPNRDGRCITSIYYLNKDWDVKTDGGLLRIFPEGWTNQVADIEPVFDRMLFFWSDRRNPHEVQPAYRTRYAITLWYFDAKEREEARLRHQRELTVAAKKTSTDEPKK